MAFVPAYRRGFPVTRPLIDVNYACTLGERCDICKVVATDIMPLNENVCDSCLDGRSSFKAKLESACQRIITKHFDREQDKEQYQARLKNLTPASLRLLRCEVVKEMCYRYTIALAFDMFELMKKLNEEDPGCILAIQEIFFQPHLYWRYSHWVFIIYTREGLYVFDPTGIQFGPDWAMLQQWSEYMRDKVYFIYHMSFLGRQYFHTKRSWPPRDLGIPSSEA